jgi:hypothetical protein
MRPEGVAHRGVVGETWAHFNPKEVMEHRRRLDLRHVEHQLTYTNGRVTTRRKQ